MDWIFPHTLYPFWQCLFLKSIAFTYFIAFWSLLVQVRGLYGSKGILPISLVIQSLPKSKKLYFKLPTLFWLNSSDRTIYFAALFGMIASVLAFLGVVPALFFFLLWFTYLSFLIVGSDFLMFQWDVLLLEVGFIAIFFAILTPPPPMLVFLLWFLLFRFMFSSGLVKFVWGSKEWRTLDAMAFHYETQPIPNRIAYYVHNLPKAFHKITTLVVFFVEMILPFFIFAPLEIRIGVFVLMVGFQVIIFISGNFAFFNILTAALCIPLLMDLDPQLLHLGNWGNSAASHPHPYVSTALTIVAVFLLFLNIGELGKTLLPFGRYLQFFQKVTLGKYIGQFVLVNHYGLFANMTTRRFEITIEGSDDEVVWKEYEFKWKPGDVKRAPSQVAPHQPRIDWQMWFAALTSYRQNSWFTYLLICLLRGSQDVIRLLKKNPFPEKPPRFIRCKIYQYRFTDLKTKRETGNWWTSRYLGAYTATFSIAKRESPGSSTTAFNK